MKMYEVSFGRKSFNDFKGYGVTLIDNLIFVVYESIECPLR